VEIVTDKIHWANILEEHFKSLRDVYFEYEYFNLFAKSFNVEPEAIFWEDENVKIFWSHFIRDISTIELFKDYNFFDLITPYGYGGPLIIKKTEEIEEIKKSLNLFLTDYKKYALEKNYICEFIRFHPIIDNWRFFQGIINIKYLNDTVAIDLSQSIEDICNNMVKKTRYYTRKSLKEFEKVSIVNKPSEIEIKDFVSLYTKTMDKNKAAKKYYFSTNFIEDHYKFDNFLIYCKNADNIIGSSAIFLKGSFIMHYHLSATNYDFQYPPSRATLWKAIEYAKENGFKWFHLGGGVSSNDSLFHFKKGFSNIYLPFYIGNIMFLKKPYEELVSLNSDSKENPDFFPLYRVGYDNNII
jgi:hypothetical protein